MSRIPKKLVLACTHKSEKKGGMNIDDMKDTLSRLYPDKDFSKKSRKELERFCNQQEEIVDAKKEDKYRYFESNVKLNEEEKAYCRCNAHSSVNEEHSACVANSDVNCYDHYDWTSMPTDEIDALTEKRESSSVVSNKGITKPTDKLARACSGRYSSTYGMNTYEMRLALSELYPDVDFSTMKRAQLEEYCKQKDEVKKALKESYFRPDSPLSEHEERYCRCIAHVSAKGGSYNPYAVCTKSVGREGKVNCSPYYNYDKMPKEEVEALARNKGVSVDELKKRSDQEYRDSK